MTCDKVRLADKIRLADFFLSETQVRGGNRTRFFGVVHEIGLRVVFGRFTDDLDGVLVGADRTVGTESVEHRLVHTGIVNMEVVIIGKACMRNIIVNTDGKVGLLFSFHIIKDGFDHRRGEFF